jgi:hypothetical protein
MINLKELEICKKRGHNCVVHMGLGDWMRCPSCGMWLRQVVEEREDEPPESEQSVFAKKARR